VRLAAALLAAACALASPTLAAAADYAPGAPLERFTGARADYAFRCKGCHGFAGEGTAGHVPRLDGFVGLFTLVEGGRDYLMRVPGVARSVLEDDRLAAVLNWMLNTYGDGRVAPGFAPFTAEEVGEARRRPLLDPEEVRHDLVSEIQERRLVEPGQDWFRASLDPRG
jgi:hypothetical protein